MKVLEFEAKKLLADQGLTVPPNAVATSLEEAAAVAQLIGGPVVLKAQIPIGGRMKAGGILFADTPQAATLAAHELLGATIRTFTVDRLLVEQKIDIAAEIFLGVTYDTQARVPIILAAKAGGIDVEGTTQLVQQPFSLLSPLSEYVGRDIAAALGFRGGALFNLGRMITKVVHCFVQWDALLLEINPLVLDTSGKWWVADVHLEVDDDAAYRQEALLRQLPVSVQSSHQRSDFEERAAEIDSADHRGVAGRLIPFKGSLGLLIGGGGASLTIMDAMLDAGLEPANYCEIGGNPSVWKIKELTKLILSQPQVNHIAVIMNVVNNTRVDLVARGVVKGVLELGRVPHETIIAFRIPGSWEDEGRAIMARYQVPFFGRETSIDQVVEAIKCRS